MAEPLFIPSDQLTKADEIPAVAETPVGAPGSTLGVTGEEDEEDGESPTIFLAITVNVRGIPFVKPVKVADKTFATVKGEPTEGVTM
jgi:hypothetical protein